MRGKSILNCGRHSGGIAALALLLCSSIAPAQTNSFADWTVFIANDTCPDYTWGNDEVQTRKNFADLVRSHLDEMNRTDPQPPESQNHYNMAVTLEALCFAEKYPDRKEELIRRIKEGRVSVSPFLCNTLWGFQSTEGFLRSLYPARRLEREWGVPKIEVAHHIECPSLPWGAATLLAGCGVRWVNVPFLDYDCTYGRLKVPPLFIHEGPDGSQVRVILDTFASKKANYTQGAHLLSNPQAITNEWLPHYQKLGAAYPLRAVLASGTHGDTHASSAGQTRGFSEKIISYNAGSPPHPKLVNASFAQFCQVVDEAQAKAPFLQTQRGCFGHSWDLWPVSLAYYAAQARENERRFLAAETMMVFGGLRYRKTVDFARPIREFIEWRWAMLSDHAWNGSDDKNRLENARLRREWSAESSESLSHPDRLRAYLAKPSMVYGAKTPLEFPTWWTMGVHPNSNHLAVFNSQSFPRSELVRAPGVRAPYQLKDGNTDCLVQLVEEDGGRVLYFVSPKLDGFALKQFQFVVPPSDGSSPSASTSNQTNRLRAGPQTLESPFYKLVVDEQTGGLGSLVHKATGNKLVAGKGGRTVCQTLFFDGQEHTMADAKSEVVAEGPVFARLRVTGTVVGIGVTNIITVYADLDRVDFDLRIHKPVSTKEQRLCQVFPVMRDGAQLRIETTAAVLRPDPPPKGDLLPGADTRRFAVQGFVDASTADFGITLAPLDAFVLRRDLGDITFEALGNDQNYKEVTKDQDGVTEFRFRYSLRAHRGAYDNAETIAWSRNVAFPLLSYQGSVDASVLRGYQIMIDPARAIATCFKPADGEGRGECILRLWEVGEKSGPLRIEFGGFKRVYRTDLLERDIEELPIQHRTVKVDLPARGFASLRLVP